MSSDSVGSLTGALWLHKCVCSFCCSFCEGEGQDGADHWDVK